MAQLELTYWSNPLPKQGGAGDDSVRSSLVPLFAAPDPWRCTKPLRGSFLAAILCSVISFDAFSSV